MRFMRFEHDGKIGFGVLENEGMVRVYAGDMFAGARPTSKRLALANVTLLIPCLPGKMVALWNNSRIQIEELKRDTPKEVLWFLKPPSSFITHGQQIVYPVTQTERVVLEGELGVVIGKKCKGVTADEARDCIFGYTIINDVTSQDVIKRDPTFPQYDRGKGFDTFGVFGPYIATDLDPMTLSMRSYIDGKLQQNFPVTDYVFNPWQAVAEITRTMTLNPGDVIAMGTSLNAARIKPGDSVEIKIDGIGALVNTVIAEQRVNPRIEVPIENRPAAAA